MSQAPSPIKLSVKWILLDVVGAGVSAFGTYQLVEPGGQRGLGYACLAIGVPMMLVAVVQILKRARRGPR